MLAVEVITVPVTPSTKATEVKNSEQLELRLEQIVYGAHQPRKRFEPKAMAELCDSVRAWGVLQPILVRPIGDDRFEIVAGERRFMASERTGRATIPAVVREMSDAEALEVALLENLQRENLSEIEEAEGLLGLLSVRLGRSLAETVSLLYRMDNEHKAKVTLQILGSEAEKIVEATFGAVGKLTWQSFVATRLPLLKLPGDLIEALRCGEISPLRARLIARVSDSEERRAVLETAQREGWSNAQLRERIAPTQSVGGAPILGRLHSLSAALDREFVWNSVSRRQQVERLVRELERIVVEDAMEGGAHREPPSARGAKTPDAASAGS
jgi:ParB family transcriptional regulator, chromosome partitioning protein